MRQVRQFSQALRALLTLGLLALILGICLTPRPSPAAAPQPGEDKIVPPGPLDFEACARLAIRQSPYLLKSAMDIDIKRLDESDSRWSMVPPVSLQTYYYLERPSSSSKPYSLNFSWDPYNPLGSFFLLQAQKMVTQMAIYGHMHTILQGLERVGKQFLELATMKRQAALQDDLVKACGDNLAYAANRLEIGTGTSLEVRVATQESESAKNEKERLEISQRRTLSSLKTFLGLKPEEPFNLDLHDASRQVLGSFNPAAATLEQAKDRSFELKIEKLRARMQEYNVSVAKTKVYPSILINAQTLNPLYSTSGGMYVGVGLDIPVWDGFKRIRNVSRQKTILRQIGLDKDMKEGDMADQWNTLQEDLKSAAGALKLAQSKEEVARLKERQAEIRYQSGGKTLDTWLDARNDAIEAQKITANKALEYDEYVLNLRKFSGDLGYSYVDQNSWQK
ncbi:MAG: TolC family protein [Desulfobaccales bacterium]|jgi:outer membrane protein TolC